MFETLKTRREEIAGKKLVVGFDGFVDTIVRPVAQTASEDVAETYYDTITAFGELLLSRAEKSCSVELLPLARKLGGNMPYLSNGAGTLGLDVSCVGMLGEGGIDPVFRDMPCTLYSYAAPGTSTCLEFDDGKVLLAPRYTLPGDPWQLVERATDGKIVPMLREADLTALVNWSELDFSHSLWKTAFEKAFAPFEADMSCYVFFDLCDCTRKSDGDLRAVLSLMAQFGEKRTAVLSLNENEAHVICERLCHGETDPAEAAEAVRTTFGITEVIVHTIRESVLSSARGVVRRATDFIEHPKQSTGAGDNFNGASCFAAVMGLDDEARIAFANRFASFYVGEGRPPRLEEM